MTGLLSLRRNRVPANRTSSRWLAPLQDFEEMVERFWNYQGDELSMNLVVPPVDLVESDSEIKLQMDLPGISPKDIDIQVSGNMLTISGERKQEKEDNSQTCHRMERRIGRFSRTMLLPSEIQEDQVDARYSDGVLRIRFPKSPEATAKHIVVKT